MTPNQSIPSTLLADILGTIRELQARETEIAGLLSRILPERGPRRRDRSRAAVYPGSLFH